MKHRDIGGIAPIAADPSIICMAPKNIRDLICINIEATSVDLGKIDAFDNWA